MFISKTGETLCFINVWLTKCMALCYYLFVKTENVYAIQIHKFMCQTVETHNTKYTT